MNYVLLAFAGLLMTTYLWYGSTAQIRLTDKEYIQKQRILGNEDSDSDILVQRGMDDASRVLWKVKNAELRKEKTRRGLGSESFTLQDNLVDELMWFNENNMTVTDFVDRQYPETKGYEYGK